VADRWWLVAGRRNDGRRDWSGNSCGRRSDEDRLTSLFGGNGECDRGPVMGTVEPLWEKATEPLEHDTEGDSGAGLEFRLDCCELDMVERRFIHDRLRDGRLSSSAMSWSLGAYPFTTPVDGRSGAVSPLVILLTMRRGWRPS
jgi:hypothetical protein